MPSGVAIVDFGALVPITNRQQKVGAPCGDKKITVTGQTGILAASSKLEAWVMPQGGGTADHSDDEHYVENLRVTAGGVVDNTSFDIDVECTLGSTYGQFQMGWAWT